MISQLSLFENSMEGSRNNTYKDNTYKEKFKFSILLSAVGDSLGWPLEFNKKKPLKKIETFIKWRKLSGGKWWGYIEEIAPGEYSDDTQLTLAVARAVRNDGKFDPNYFSYLELPLWLDYERGGGKSVKLAARNLSKKKTLWFMNFYKTKELSYFNAGANGAAMRNLPIALVNMENEERFILETIKNSLITHGHPRALIGSLTIGAAQIYLLRNNLVANELLSYINHILFESDKVIKQPFDPDISNWLKETENISNIKYYESFKKYIKEASDFLKEIPRFLNKEIENYYALVKALEPSFKSSGISTTCAAIYIFLKHSDRPAKGLINAANFVGTDTDTIASFVGSLIGAFLGASIDQKLLELQEKIQDRNYLQNIAKKLWLIYKGKLKSSESKRKLQKEEGYSTISKWKNRLKEIFNDNLKEGDEIIHPVLGRGTIEYKTRKKLDQKENYIVNIFKIKFDCGQTIYLHSRANKITLEA